MNIYELTAEWQRVQDALEGGEDVGDLLETLDMEITHKADGYARIIRNMESDVAGLKTAEKNLATKRKVLEHNINRLKANLYECMKRTGKVKFKTDLFSFSIAKNGGNLPVILEEGIDLQSLPKDLVNVEITPNMEAIRAYITETGDITFAHFGERGETLRIK